MHRIKYFLTILLLGGGWVSAQQCDITLSGNVQNDEHKPISGANVVVYLNEEPQEATFTDSNGNFTIGGICDANRIEVTHISMASYSKPLNLNQQHNELDIVLNKEVNLIEEVKIRTHYIHRKAGVEVKLRESDLENHRGKTLGQTLTQIAGIETIQTGNSIAKPMIHGMHSSRVAIFNNDVRMEDQEWGIEHAPNIDANLAQSIHVVKGSKALQHGGDAIGGIVLLNPKVLPTTDTLTGSVTAIGATNGRGGVLLADLQKGTSGNWSFGMQGSLKRFGDVQAPDYMLSNTGVKEYDLTARAVYANEDNLWGGEFYYSLFNTELGILAASHIGSIYDLYRVLQSNEPLIVRDFTYIINAPKQKITHHLTKTKIYREMGRSGKLSLQYSLQYNRRREYETRRNSAETNSVADIDLGLTTQSLQLLWEKNTKFGKFAVGTDFQYQQNRTVVSEARRLIPNYNQTSGAIFAIWETDISEQWHLDAGARFDYTHVDAKKFYSYRYDTDVWNEKNYAADFSDIIIEDYTDIKQYLTNPKFQYLTYSSSLGIQWKPSSSYRLELNAAHAQRSPNPSELFSDGIHHSAARIEEGDLRIRPETSYQLALTNFFQLANQKLTLEVTPYFNRIKDYITLVPTSLETTIQGAFQVWDYVQCNAIVTGFDAFASYKLTPQITYQSTFSYLYGQNLTDEIPLIDMAPSKWVNTLRYASKGKRSWYVDIENIQTFRQSRYPDTYIFSYDVDNNGTPEVIDLVTPTGAYNLTNVNSGITFDLKKKKQLKTSIAINNLFNRDYRDYLNRMRYFADDMGRNIQLQIMLNF